jgi:Protein of unknown function (DUF3570)
LFLGAAMLATVQARAQYVDFDTTHTLYYEAPVRTNMFVYSPGVNLAAHPWEFLDVHGGWEADVVSGASVATKAGPAYKASQPAADVISTASVHDLRNVGKGGFTIKKDAVSLDTGYTYSTEHDYRSHSIDASARTELFEHNTQLQIDWSHNWDSVCNRVQGPNAKAERFIALEDSTGCFASSNALRSTAPVSIDSFQGGWSQAWTPIFQTQFLYTAQILNGFQSDPYRSVVLGQGIKAQEHVPDNRTRHSVTGRFNFFLRPLKAALRFMARGYWDTWDVKSVTGDVEFEKYLTDSWRASLHFRYYKQSGSVFWSDDYTGGDPPLGPKGAYFTGDRELSPFSSYMGGLRTNYTITPEKGRILGMMTSLKLGAYFEMVQFDYDEYTLGGQTITGGRAFIGGLSIAASF